MASGVEKADAKAVLEEAANELDWPVNLARLEI